MLFALGVICLLFVFLIIGVPVAFALGAVSVVGLIVVDGFDSLVAISDIAWQTTSEFLLVAIPLFVLMSEIISISGVGRDLFAGVERWLARLPGGIAMSAVVASAVFGAVSGTAVGVAAVMGGIAIPEMLRRNYDRRMAAGTVAASSGLGMIIPPSLPIIVYGVITETSIAQLFAKSIIPGIIITAIFCAYIAFHSIRQSKKGHPITATSDEPIRFYESLLKSGPTVLLILAVLGSIYFGIATPTEAAAVGVAGALVLAAAKRTLTPKVLVEALHLTTRVSVMLLAILLTAMLFSYMLSVAQVPQQLTEAVVRAQLSGWVFFLLVMVLMFILGLFLDAISIVLIAVPIVFPVLMDFGYDPIWFGVVLMINMCFAVATPPVGLCLYVVRDSVAELKLSDVVYGTIPFLVLYVASIVLFTVFPRLITG